MSDFLGRTFYGNTMSEWLIASGIIVAAVVAGRLIYWIIGRVVKRAVARTGNKLGGVVVDMGEGPLVFVVTVVGFWLAYRSLNTTAAFDIFIVKVFFALFTIAGAWFLTRLSDALFNDFLAPLVAETESELDDQLLPLARKAVKITIWVLTAIIALSNAGFDVAAIIAGLGLGGLAFALAAQDSVSNLFGGFTIMADQPFKLNERVKIAGFDGTIEEIGLRSTRLKTLENRIVTIPNSTFTKSPVENVSSEPNRKVVLNLGLTYDMDEAKVERAMALLREIAAANADLEENVVVGFNAFGDFALNVAFIYYIRSGSDIMGTQTAINLAILQRFNAEGLEFAFPTQTIQLSGGSGGSGGG
ncbi:MAG: mechanosensitive ion channel family protein [Gemmatimonadales bacterium]